MKNNIVIRGNSLSLLVASLIASRSREGKAPLLNFNPLHPESSPGHVWTVPTLATLIIL